MAGSVPKSTPPLTLGHEMFSSRAATPASPSSRAAIATNSSCRAGDADDDRRAQPGQVRQLMLDEGLDAVVVQADRIEHAAGGFDRPPGRIAAAWLGRDRLGHDRSEPAKFDQARHLAGVAKRAGGHHDRIGKPQAAQADR